MHIDTIILHIMIYQPSGMRILYIKCLVYLEMIINPSLIKSYN
jgi:hypothetical protein